MVRRWSTWALCSALLAVLAFAPFRHEKADSSVALGPGAPALGTDPDSPRVPAEVPATAGTGSAGAAGDPSIPVDRAGSAGDGGGAAPEAPSGRWVPPPTDAQLAVLGPLIRAMDTGQRAGTPLVLGIATSLVASGLPGDDDVPAELRPVVSALADLIATPGAHVNDLTAQGSYHLTQLDRALGQLAFANPTLNELIHEVAAELATLGRSADPVSPPGSQSLSDLAVLLTFFVVE